MNHFINKELFNRLVSKYGTPLFVYKSDEITGTIQSMQDTIGEDVRIYYSVKANLNPTLLRLIASAGCGFEVASAGELDVVLASGIHPSNIIFAGPGKRKDELLFAAKADIDIFNVESLNEILLLENIGHQLNRIIKICLRLNLAMGDFEYRRQIHWFTVNQFGIEEESLLSILETLSKLKHIKCIGVHLHSASEILDAEVLGKYLKWLMEKSFFYKEYMNLEIINLGGGWGQPQYADEKPLDIVAVKKVFSEIFRQYPDLENRKTKLFIESGRFLIGGAGYYIARVVDVKTCRGKNFVVLDGGINHCLFKSNTFRAVNRPVSVYTLKSNPNVRPYEIVGPLCTPIDKLASSVFMPDDIQPDDIVYFSNCGAYTKASSSLNFLGHPWPTEILIKDEDECVIAKSVEMIELMKLQGAFNTIE